MVAGDMYMIYYVQCCDGKGVVGSASFFCDTLYQVVQVDAKLLTDLLPNYQDSKKHNQIEYLGRIYVSTLFRKGILSS